MAQKEILDTLFAIPVEPPNIEKTKKDSINAAIEKPSLWGIASEQDPTLLEDILDEHYAERQTMLDMLPNLLKESTSIIKTIHEYILKHPDIKSVDTPTGETIQTFNINNKQYLLTNEIHLKKIYKIILNFQNKTLQRKTIAKSPKSLTESLSMAAESEKMFTHSVLKLLSKHQVLDLIPNALSFILIDKINSLEEKKELILKSTLLHVLGKTIFETFLYRYFIYYDITDSTLHKTNTKTKKHIQEFKKYDLPELLQLLEHIKNPEQAKTLKYLKDKNIPLIEEKELWNQIYYALKKYILTNYTDNPEMNLEEFNNETVHQKYAIYCAEISAEILEWLIEIGFFIETRDESKRPMLSLKDQYKVDIFTAASYYKPHISAKSQSGDYFPIINNQVIFRLNLLKENIRHSKHMRLYGYSCDVFFYTIN